MLRCRMVGFWLSAQPRIWQIGRISGLGLRVDDRFVDKVLMPGFVEAHGHAMEGGVWQDLFLGYFERHAPGGALRAA